MSLLKWVDALVLPNAINSLPGTTWQNENNILDYIFFFFWGGGGWVGAGCGWVAEGAGGGRVVWWGKLTHEVKLAVIFFLNVTVILAAAYGKRSHFDLSNSPFAIWNFACLAKNPRLFRIRNQRLLSPAFLRKLTLVILWHLFERSDACCFKTGAEKDNIYHINYFYEFKNQSWIRLSTSAIISYD